MSNKYISIFLVCAACWLLPTLCYSQSRTFYISADGKMRTDSMGGRAFILKGDDLQYKVPKPYTFDANVASRLGYSGVDFADYARLANDRINNVNSSISVLGIGPVIELKEGNSTLLSANRFNAPFIDHKLEYGKKYSIVVKDIKTEALVRSYNNDADWHDDLYNAWKGMFDLHNRIYHFRDVLLKELTEGKSNATSGELFELASIKADFDKSKTTTILIDDYRKSWSWYTQRNTYNPFGVAHINVRNLSFDTVAARHNLEWLQPALNNPNLSDRARNLIIEQMKNHLYQLSLVRSYNEQLKLSEAKKTAFNGSSTIAELNIPNESDYYFLHNASTDMKPDQKFPREVLNSNIVSVVVYNIPQGKQLKMDLKDSVIKTEQLQFTRIATAFMDGFGAGTGSFIPASFFEFPKENQKSLGSQENLFDTLIPRATIKGVLQQLKAIDEAVAPYITELPPVTRIELAEEPANKAVQVQSKVIDAEDNRFSHLYRYTLSLQGSDSKDAKEFKFRRYKIARVQFTGGAHLPFGQATVIKSENNQYSTVSDNSLKYTLGIKLYFRNQTFRDLGAKEVWKNIHKSWFVHIGADVNYPLNNLYPSVGFDIVPGLGVSAGLHAYRYTNYTIVNGTKVGEEYIYKLRRGGTINILMDASLVTRTFISFLKL